MALEGKWLWLTPPEKNLAIEKNYTVFFNYNCTHSHLMNMKEVTEFDKWARDMKNVRNEKHEKLFKDAP